MSTPKKIAGTMVIPVLTFLILEMICMAHGNNIITNMKSFDNFVVYTAIVMLTTIALSINLNSGRFDFSLGSMAALASIIGAKLSYAVLGGDAGSAVLMLFVTIVAGAVLGLVSGGIYVLLRIPPIINLRRNYVYDNKWKVCNGRSTESINVRVRRDMDLCGCNHCGRIDPKHCDF